MRWIRYEIGGNTYDQGPYGEDVIHIHKRNIEAFEGVKNVRLVFEEEKTDMESFLWREGYSG